MSEGGRSQTATMVSAEDKAESSTTAVRVLSVVLVFELLWLLLVSASIVFLAAHLGSDADEFTGDQTLRGAALVAVPALAVVIGVSLAVARRAVERRAAAAAASLSGLERIALWVTAAANAIVTVSISVTLYHAHMTWIVVGILLATATALIAVACIRAALSR